MYRALERFFIKDSGKVISPVVMMGDITLKAVIFASSTSPVNEEETPRSLKVSIISYDTKGFIIRLN